MLALLLRRAAREPELEELRDLRASTKVRLSLNPTCIPTLP